MSLTEGTRNSKGNYKDGDISSVEQSECAPESEILQLNLCVRRRFWKFELTYEQSAKMIF